MILIPWIFWFGAAYLSHKYENQSDTIIGVLSILGLIAPFVTALIIMLPDVSLRTDLFSRVFNFKEVRKTYLFGTFLIMPVSILLAQAISLLFGYDIEQFNFRNGFTFSSGVFPVWFMLILAPVIEELAWHSYGTDCLRSKYNLLITSILFALFWGVWHFPLSFIKDYYHSNLLEEGLLYSINFFVSLFPFVIIMNWLYYKTHRNILVPIVFHITAGYFNEIFCTHPMSKVIQTIILLIFSYYLWYKDKRFFMDI